VAVPAPSAGAPPIRNCKWLLTNITVSPACSEGAIRRHQKMISLSAPHGAHPMTFLDKNGTVTTESLVPKKPATLTPATAFTFLNVKIIWSDSAPAVIMEKRTRAAGSRSRPSFKKNAFNQQVFQAASPGLYDSGTKPARPSRFLGTGARRKASPRGQRLGSVTVREKNNAPQHRNLWNQIHAETALR